MAMPACKGEQRWSPALVVRPSARHTHTAILLHDVASSGSIFGRDLLRTGTTSLGKTLDYLFPGVRFDFPTSRRRTCYALEQSRITLWFDVGRFQDPAFGQEVQRSGLCASARDIVVILRWEMRLVPPGNICGSRHTKHKRQPPQQDEHRQHEQAMPPAVHVLCGM